MMSISRKHELVNTLEHINGWLRSLSDEIEDILNILEEYEYCKSHDVFYSPEISYGNNCPVCELEEELETLSSEEV